MRTKRKKICNRARMRSPLVKCSTGIRRVSRSTTCRRTRPSVRRATTRNSTRCARKFRKPPPTSARENSLRSPASGASSAILNLSARHESRARRPAPPAKSNSRDPQPRRANPGASVKETNFRRDNLNKKIKRGAPTLSGRPVGNVHAEWLTGRPAFPVCVRFAQSLREPLSPRSSEVCQIELAKAVLRANGKEVKKKFLKGRIEIDDACGKYSGEKIFHRSRSKFSR
jgi:hypothetical protein